MNASVMQGSQGVATETSYIIFIILLVSVYGIPAVLMLRKNHWRPNYNLNHFTAEKTQNWSVVGTSLFASSAGLWIMFVPLEFGALYGIWAVLFYALAVVLSYVAIMFLSPYLTFHKEPNIAFTDQVRRRFGPVAQCIVIFISFLTMWATLSGELILLSRAIVALSPGVSGLAIIILTSLITFMATSAVGLKISLFTDRVQAVLIIILTLVCSIYLFSTTTIVESRRAEAFSLKGSGLFSGITSVITYICAYIFDQGPWQRIYCSNSVKDVKYGILLAAAILGPIMIISGFLGIVANAGDLLGPNLRDANNALPQILAFSNTGLKITFMIILILLATSTIDTLQVGIQTIFLKDLSRYTKHAGYVLQGLSFVINALAVLMAVLFADSASIILLFLAVNLLSVAALPIVVCIGTKRVNKLSVFLGFAISIVSIMISGWSWTGELIGGLEMFILPDGPASISTLITYVVVLIVTMTTAFLVPFLSEKFGGKLQGDQVSTKNLPKPEIVPSSKLYNDAVVVSPIDFDF